MILLSDFFFSKLTKYLLFFSPCSTICAFDLIICPFNSVSVNLSSSVSFRIVPVMSSHNVFEIASLFIVVISFMLRFI